MSQVWLHIEVEESLLKEATQVFDNLGIDIETAVNMFLKHTILVNGLPFKAEASTSPYKAGKGYQAMLKLGEEAKKNGTANMTLEEINAEIEAVRQKPVNSKS